MKTLTIVLAGSLLLAGCAKQEAAPTPEPVPAATLVRTLTFPTVPGLNHDTTYAATGGTANLDATELFIGIGTGTSRDDIGFRVPRTALTAGMVGSYPLLNQAKSPGAVTKMGYGFTPYSDRSHGRWLIYGETDDTRGQVQLTAYDASRQLISGTYAMAIDNMQNLLDVHSVPYAPPLCNLRVSGTFTNLKVQ